MSEDPRRNLPRTDTLLASDWVRAASTHLNATTTRAIVRRHLDRARTQPSFTSAAFRDDLVADLTRFNSGIYRATINATGVVVHTNLGRAPLSPWASDVAGHTAAYVDIEMDLESGKRGRRGVETTDALTLHVPAAEDALVVNNCASALMLVAAQSRPGRLLLSRGEFVEIGAGFRLHELMRSVGATLTEVGSTNRTHLADYRRECEAGEVSAILKIHPSNYAQSGFTSAPSTQALAQLAREYQVPLVVDIGSGLLAPNPHLPNEPDATSELEAGADVVLFSGDKLLGGPQAGIILGKRQLVTQLATHPLARAVRASKFVLATLAATVVGEEPPVHTYVGLSSKDLRERTEALAATLNTAEVSVDITPHAGRVGGGGGTGVELPGWAVRLPESLAKPLRVGEPSVVTHVQDGACLVDVRCVDPSDDHVLAARIIECARAVGAAHAETAHAPVTRTGH